MCVSSENELQYDSLIQAGIDPRNIYQDKASGARDNREGLQRKGL